MTTISKEPELKSTTVLSELSGEDDVLAALSEFFSMSKEDIEMHTRRHEIVAVRHMIMYILREYGEMSFPAIGRLIGNRDHTTVIHAYNKTKGEVEKDPKLLEGLDAPIALVQSLRDRKKQVEQELKDMNAKLYAEALEYIQSKRTERLRPKVRVIPERDMKVLEMYREGLTLQNMAGIFKLSRERIRQIVVKTIRHLAINESLTHGIVMDLDVMVEEENKKRKQAQEAKKVKPIKVVKEKMWSTYYDACKECSLTTYKHVRKGLCEKCIGSFRPENREEFITKAGSVCAGCGTSRTEAIRVYGRDLHITKDNGTLCRKCFTSRLVKQAYKRYKWSRKYSVCRGCGLDSVPHARAGWCTNCAPNASQANRDEIIASHNNQCDSCGMTREEARQKSKGDFRITKHEQVFCVKCFLQNNRKLAKQTE